MLTSQHILSMNQGPLYPVSLLGVSGMEPHACSISALGDHVGRWPDISLPSCSSADPLY